ncbi:Nucleosome assembly protein 1-like 1, partial [Cichlidogyrus casuarinus]
DEHVEALHNVDADEIPLNVKEYFHLPESVKRRVKALKNLQIKTLEIDCEFYRKLYALEKDFEIRHEEIFKKRSAIVRGDVEPSDAECKFDDKDMEEWSNIVKEVHDMALDETSETNVSGIPDFWLKALRHDTDIAEMIMKHDVPVLSHLTNITCNLSGDAQPGFTLDFYFSTNEWFANAKLSKTYFFAYEIPKENPFEYTGPEIVACQGCPIDWNNGKKLTVKTVTKVQKHKSRSETRQVTKDVDNDSFFNFFDEKKQAIDDHDADVDFLELDFKIGQFIRETLIPRAVLFFTGEAPEHDEDDFDMDEEEDDEDDDEDESDEDDNGDHDHHSNKHVRKHHHAHHKAKRTTNNNEECKQQ